MNDTEQASEKMPAAKTGEHHKFTRDIIWVGIAQLCSSIIIGLGTMPALTKFYPSNIYGVWAQIQITYALLSSLIGMQLGLAVIKFLSGDSDKAKRRQALGAMLLAITVISIIFALLADLFASQLSVFLFNNANYSDFIRLTIAWIIVSAYFSFFGSYLRARGKIKLFSFQQILISFLTLAIVTILATQGVRLEWVVISVIGVWVLFTLLFFIMVVDEVGFPLPNVSGLTTYLTFAVPQIPGAILLWIVGSSDRYFITHFLGLSKTGIYTSSDTLGGLIGLFYGPIQFVLYPMLARLWEDKRDINIKNYMEYSTKLYLTLAIPAAAGIALLSQPLLRLVTTSQYLLGNTLVFLIAAGSLFLGIYNIDVNVILLSKHSRLLPLMISTAAVINVVTNIILIPHIGMLGAAISNIASFFALALIVGIWARNQVHYGLDFKYLLKVIVSTLVMAILVYFIKPHGALKIFIAVLAGVAVFGISLIVLKAFSKQDKELIKNIWQGLIPIKLNNSKQ